jgi:hypothetical protein
VDYRSWIVSAMVILAGCSTWTTAPMGKSVLQPARMSPDSVVIEFAMLDLADSAEGPDTDLWRGVDEQQISVQTRQKLAQHGFRCGVVGGQLPAWLSDQLATQNKRLELDESQRTAVVSDLLTERRIQCRANQRRSVPVGINCKELEVGMTETGAEPPRKYRDAQCHLALTVNPKGDGQVELELVPEIQHGAMHQRWIGRDGLFRLDASRDSVRYDELKVVATLLPGQTLVLSASPAAGGLSTAFASQSGSTLESVSHLPDKAASPNKLVLLRLAQTQFDDLFSPLQSLTPIATPPP